MHLTLLEDDHLQIYVWVQAQDRSIKVSPHFDYREDAVQWYEQNHQRWDHYSALPATDSYI